MNFDADLRPPTDYFLRGRRVLTPEGIGPRHLHIRAGKIAGIGPYEAVPAGAPVVDAGDLVVLPGLVDTHVHINDPGRADWEGFATATRAAAAGGVTTVVDMPLNAIPATTTLEGLHAKLRALEEKAFVNVGLCGGLVPENAANVGDLYREGLLAFKCFLAETGVKEFTHVSDRELAAGMKSLAAVNAPLFVHAELPEPLEAAEKALGPLALDPRSYDAWLLARPKSAEDAAVDLVAKTAKSTGARAHIVHLSASSALEVLWRAKDENIALTAETCPHYLTFASEEIADGQTAFKCAPPIREAENREKLWGALKEGSIAQVVTDHSPATVELKCSGSGDFTKAWGGIASLQLGLAIVWTGAAARGASLVDVARWMSEMPARLVGLYGRKGCLAVGADADVIFFDPEADFFIDANALEHKNKITAYQGRTLKGRVVRTILGGQTIFTLHDGPTRTGTFHGTPQGRWLRRN